VEQEEVDVAIGGERAEHVEVAGREPGQAEERQALRQLDEAGIFAQAGACGLEPLGRTGMRDTVA
jgi:hypothetical protein